MAKSILSGLPAETRKKIREQIKVGKKLAKQEEEQEYEQYWTGLNAIKKQIDGLIDKAKASGSIPQGTTLKRLTMMPKSKPARWSSAFKRIFGRKTKKVVVQNKKATPKAKAKAPKKKAKTKKARHKSAGAMVTTMTKQQRYESKRQNNQHLVDRNNEARRLRRANGKTD